MKIALINLSGNIGKTTLAVNLLKPRMSDASIYSIESINIGADASGEEVQTMKGKKYGELIDKLMLEDNAIIDVGASNVDDFIKHMQQFDGSHEEFDIFIVPTVSDEKVMGDTVNTIELLTRIGVPSEKIRVIFNKVDVDDQVEDEFASILGYAKVTGNCIATPAATVFQNEVYERAISAGTSVGSIISDTIDYRAKLKTAVNDEEKAKCVQMIAMKRLAATANKNLEQVFAEVISNG